MSFGIRIDGLDDLTRELERMQRGLSQEDIDFWCKRILNDVKLKAPNDLGESFVMEVSLDEQHNPNIKLSYLPKLKDLIVETVKSYLNETPITTRELFEEIIKTLEKKAEGGTTQDV